MSNPIESSCRSVLSMAALALAGAWLSAGASYANESTSPADNDTAVRALLTQVGEAWNAGDAQGTAQPFTEDGELISADGTFVRGRAEIAKYHSKLVTGSMKGSRLITAGTEVRFLTPQVAIMHTRASFLMSGKTEPERHAVFTIVAVRDAANWRMALLQSTRAPVQTAGTSR